MTNKRIATQTVRCNWCFKINPGDGWIPERRRKGGGYSNVICRKCVNFFFGGVVPTLSLKDLGNRPFE